MEVPHLRDWWASGVGSNSYTRFETSTGALSVYVRRHIADRDVMMIANVSTVSGFGASRTLYREFCHDIPTIAENILNDDLDGLLERWGWTGLYRDDAQIPSRVNQAFMDRYPEWNMASTAGQAILRARYPK